MGKMLTVLNETHREKVKKGFERSAPNDKSWDLDITMMIHRTDCQGKQKSNLKFICFVSKVNHPAVVLFD